MAQNVTPEMIPPIEPGAVASNKELDTIKLFVGQIPRSWGEEEVREIMESFGPVYDISVLKDKMSQQAKGWWATIRSYRAKVPFFGDVCVCRLCFCDLLQQNVCHQRTEATSREENAGRSECVCV